MRSRWTTALIAILVLTGALGSSLVAPAQQATALTGSEFNPGLIISDSKFFNENAMTEYQIQDFLNSKVTACTAGYTCLKSYTEATASRAANVCAAYTGDANDTAARIIYKVAQACGVNPQVILVTLQKETGLVTARSPTSATYRKAMGYGCPDTSTCDSLYYGFFNQVYSAARQFIRYGLPGNSFRYKVGDVAVQFSPNTACGASIVNIRSQATANLYNYTPYQPNGAALANLGGTGDGCSSYGNRNFWVFYSNWFGSPVEPGSEQLANFYAAQGGATGWLGAATGAQISSSTNGGGIYQTFTNGTLFWSQGGGVQPVSGAMLVAYQARQSFVGPLGWPTGPPADVSGAGISGQSQAFQNGSIYANPTGTFAVVGSTRNSFNDQGGVAGLLGWPLAEAVADSANGSGTWQSFQGGVIYSAASTGAYALSGAMLTAYQATGAQAGTLGWPVSVLFTIAANGGGVAQGFQKGSIYASTASGPFPVYEPLRGVYWAAQGEVGKLAWPTGPATTVAANGGGVVQPFQGGSIFSSKLTGNFALSGPILARYLATGGAAGTLGWPSSNLYPTSSNGGGTALGFQFGSIYEGATTGAWAVSGGIRAYYWSLQGEYGSLGWPIGAETCGLPNGGCSQPFQNGTIVWSLSGGGRLSVIPEMEAVYAANAAILGKQSSVLFTITANGGGKAQGYQFGSIYYSPAAGAFAVTGAIRAAYWSVAGEGGALGWPTSAAVLVADNGGGTVQTFQGGSIFSSRFGTQIVSQGLLAAYQALGAQDGELGWPSSRVFPTTANGGGSAQGFQNASMYYSPAAGAFAVSGPIRSFYWSMAGEGGSLGWPTGPQICGPSGSGCSQTFQNGTLVSDPNGSVRLQSVPEIEAAYQALGGPTGSLGKAVTIVFVVTANGGGRAQAFQNGSIYYSPATGAFAVSGAIRSFYWSLAGEGGSLGWPTGPQICGAPGTGCSQAFQNGTIVTNPGGGARLQSIPEIEAAYQALGGPGGPLGNPVTIVFTITANGGGRAQAFQGGSIYYSPATGAFAVSGAIRSFYWSLAGEGGSLGWPTAAQTCLPPSGSCSQPFQHGTILYSPSTGARLQ